MRTSVIGKEETKVFRSAACERPEEVLKESVLSIIGVPIFIDAGLTFQKITELMLLS